MTTRTLAVVTAGLSQPSSTRMLADRLADATQRALEDLGVDVEVEMIELRDLAHDITNNLLTGFPSSSLRPVVDSVVQADGLIAVSPIFAASYSGLFKSFFDILDADSLAGKPVLIGATGGTERHSLALEHALRPLFTYLRAVVVPTSVYAASADWGSERTNARTTEHNDALTERIERAAGELSELMSKDKPSGPEDPYADPTPFADLLFGN